MGGTLQPGVMRASNHAGKLAVAFLGAILLAPGAIAADLTMRVLESPDVVVANAAENTTKDNFNPEYPFSASVRAQNGDEQQNVFFHAIFYNGEGIEGCPEKQDDGFFVPPLQKQRNLSAGERVVLGGQAHPQQSQGPEYWPMALPDKFFNPATNETEEVRGGEHTFCFVARVSSSAPGCNTRSCVVAKEPFSAYVRLENSPPEVTEFSVGNENPRSGQEVLFRAEATDADTQPREDPLSFTWELGRAEKTGKVVRHAFTTPGDHEVTLTVSDGFDETTRTATVTVPSPSGDGGDDGRDTPGVGVLALVPIAVAALALRRRSRG